MNKLYYGDCLTIMNNMPLGCADLIYLDPPFNSNRDYNAIYQDETGRPLPDQIEAFCDLWELDEEREKALRMMPVLMRSAGIDDNVAEFWQIWMNALRKTQPRLLAYLSYMTERLLPMRGILKPTGSIYLHCDPTASHYIKALMDGIFGHQCFRGEVIWKRQSAHSDAKTKFPAVTDTIFHYALSNKSHFEPQYGEYDPEYVKKFYRHNDNDGRGPYRISDMSAPKGGGMSAINKNTGKPNGWHIYREFEPPANGWRYSPETMKRLDDEGRIHFPKYEDGSLNTNKRLALKRFLEEQKGSIITNLWTDINPVTGGAESLGYATQKPIALLERIIAASSKPGDVVFDPFCGCATTIEAAHKLDRKWIGVDIAIHAIKRVAKVRLEDRLGLKQGVDFQVEGVPHTLEGAQDLWERDKYHFQKWAVEQIDGFVTSRRTGDGGVDGRLYFTIPTENMLKSMLLEVKGGKNVGIGTVRDMRGTMEREEAPMSGLIIMDELGDRKTKNFKAEMAQAGHLEVSGVEYPRMQMLTVSEILDGKRFLTPSVAKGRTVAQPSLPLG